MHLIKYHKLYIPNEICTLVEHTPQNLRRHNQTIRFRVDLHVSSQDTNRAGREGLFEVSKFLIREGFDG